MDEKQALQLARTVVQQKIVGLADILEQHQELPGSMRNVGEVRGLAAWLDIPDIPWLQSSERLMQLEGKAANAYFEGWLEYALPWKQDRLVKKLPPHFKQYERRSKPSTGRNRNACDPLNTLLNFVYSCTTSHIETLLTSMVLTAPVAFTTQTVIMAERVWCMTLWSLYVQSWTIYYYRSWESIG